MVDLQHWTVQGLMRERMAFNLSSKQQGGRQKDKPENMIHVLNDLSEGLVEFHGEGDWTQHLKGKHHVDFAKQNEEIVRSPE